MVLFVSYHVFPANWAAAGTEFVDKYLEKVGVKVLRLVHRAVEWSHCASGRFVAAVHLAAERPVCAIGCSSQQLFSYSVHGVTRVYLPGIARNLLASSSRFASVQVETGHYVIGSVDSLLAKNAVRIHA